MMYEERRPVRWDQVALYSLITLVAILVAWWLESRFGKNVAAMVLGGLLIAGTLYLGFRLAANHTRDTLNIGVDFLAQTGQTEKILMQVLKEDKRTQGHLLRRSADIEFLDEKRVRQLAGQHAKLLVAENKGNNGDSYEWNGQVEPAEQYSGGLEVYD